MTVSSRSFFLILLFGICLGILCCSTKRSELDLKAGDLLFQDLNCGELCDAIESVTEGINGRDFSHCGMVVQVDDTLRVIEAIGEQVQLTSLEEFFLRSGDTQEIRNVALGRLKPEHQFLIDGASDFALQQLGKPYDQVFLLNDEKYYCSELLYECFKEANGGEEVFTLQLMTFKEPETGDFFPAWIEYYELLNHDIPEGEPGLNPGSISRSEYIEILW